MGTDPGAVPVQIACHVWARPTLIEPLPRTARRLRGARVYTAREALAEALERMARRRRARPARFVLRLGEPERGAASPLP